MTPSEVASWIKYVGVPMEKEVEALKRALWTMGGGGVGVGMILGLIAPFLLKKLGLA